MISRLAAIGIVAVAALLGVVAEVPTVWSPLNVLGFIPAIWASVLFDGAAIFAPVPVFAAAFACWCPRVWTGQAAIPRRSQVAAGLAIILSLTNVVLGRSYGLRYQGSSYVNTVTVVRVLCCAAIGLFVVLASKQPSVHRNLWFHVIFFSWLAWYAIPYMGELP
jgi:hypothetical protein